MEAVGRKVAENTGLRVNYDTAVTLPQIFIDAIKEGRKKHTMKFHQEDGKDVIRLPVLESLPLNLKTPTSEVRVGEVLFDYVEVKRWNEVTPQEAMQDGFENKYKFVIETEKLAKDRGLSLLPDSRVSFYHFEDILWI